MIVENNSSLNFDINLGIKYSIKIRQIFAYKHLDLGKKPQENRKL